MNRGVAHVHSHCCLLPPFVLESLARNGTPQQRARALRTLSTDATMRSLRATAGRTRRTQQPGAAVAAIAPGPRRTIYDARHTQTIPGDLVRGEGSMPSGDAAVDEAYDGLGATYDFFWQTFERSSVDDDGLALDATVHFGQDYTNAFWDGQRMVFGDGDGELFNRFTVALDAIAHELAHGVTEDESGLVHFFQPGALSESLSDVFGSLVKQWHLGQRADQADWLIGTGLFAPGVQGVALRSMKDPGTAFDDPMIGRDLQPAHMDDFVHTYEDNGGVHINSGIPNRAFYLACMALGGYAWEKAGRVWYETLCDPKLRPSTGFRRFAQLNVANAARLYGPGGEEEAAVREAWTAVGIEVT